MGQVLYTKKHNSRVSPLQHFDYNYNFSQNQPGEREREVLIKRKKLLVGDQIIDEIKFQLAAKRGKISWYYRTGSVQIGSIYFNPGTIPRVWILFLFVACYESTNIKNYLSRQNYSVNKRNMVLV